MDETTQTTTTTTTKEARPMRAEVLLALLAVVVIVGWVFHWADKANPFDLFTSPFAGLSFFGSVALVVYVLLKAFSVVSFPPKVEVWVLPVVSLIPLTGFLISYVFDSLDRLLTVGGSIALAYVSAVTYWRKQFLKLASKRIDEEEQRPSPPPPSPPPPSGEDRPAS